VNSPGDHETIPNAEAVAAGRADMKSLTIDENKVSEITNQDPDNEYPAIQSRSKQHKGSGDKQVPNIKLEVTGILTIVNYLKKTIIIQELHLNMIFTYFLGQDIESTGPPESILLRAGQLTLEEAVTFMSKSININEDRNKLKNLTRTLRRFPVALQLAASYIKAELQESQHSSLKYLGLFQSENCSGKKELTETEITSITWNLVSRSIQARNVGTFAIRIMEIMSFYVPENLPVAIFERLRLEKFQKEHIIEAIALLKEYSVVVGYGDETISTNQHLQDVIRCKMETPKALFVLDQAISLIWKYIDPAKGKDNYVVSYLPHAEVLWRHAMKHDKLIRKWATFPADLCLKYDYYGKFDKALEFARKCKSGIVRVMGKAHLDAIQIRYREAEALWRLEKHSDSLDILRVLLPLAQHVLGIRHWLTWLMVTTISLNLSGLGKHREEERFRKYATQLSGRPWCDNTIDLSMLF